MRAVLFNWFSNVASNRLSMNFLYVAESERVRRLSHEGFWVVLGQFLAVLGSVIGVRLLTELLDPAAYGELALGMTVAILINQTVLGPLGNGATRFYAPALEQGDLGGYLNAVRRLMLSASGLIVLMILLTVASLLIAGWAEWIAIAMAALIFAIFSGFTSILSGIQNSSRQRSIVALHQGLEPWLRFLIAAALLLWLGTSSAVAMAGYAAAVLFVLASQYVFFRKRVTADAPGGAKGRNWQKQIWSYSWPFSIFGIFTWMQLASDRWALNLFSTTHDVGMYAALFQLGYYPTTMAYGTLAQFVAPILFQRAGDASDYQRTNNVHDLSWQLTRLVLGATCGVFIIAVLFHVELFQILVAKQYASVSYLLPWMLLAGGLFAAGQTMALNLESQMKTRSMLAPKIATALLGITVNIAGAYLYGTTGIVAASVLFGLSYLVWMAVVSKQVGVTACS